MCTLTKYSAVKKGKEMANNKNKKIIIKRKHNKTEIGKEEKERILCRMALTITTNKCFNCKCKAEKEKQLFFYHKNTKEIRRPGKNLS